MSSTPRDGCPAMAVLDAAARAEAVDAGVQEHLDDCAECQAVLANMRSNNDFLAQHRPALAAQAAGPGMIPGCKLLGEIHRGGQGIVYKAIQTATQRTVAIKVLRAGTLAGREEQSRFEREARILGQLQHPNIVTVHDSGIAGGLHYLVLDHVSGKTLDRYIADGLPEIRATLALFAKICEAVHAAHLRGIIHRDLKASNVMIDAAGEPHVLDFGLAKATVDAADMTKMTLTGQFFGTPAWASPEQADGDMTKVDLRTDVYALGVLLYYLLTGAHPYDVSGTLHIVLENVRRAPPALPRQRRPQIDGEVETIVLKSLQKERERRYQTAGELARDIRRYLAGEAIEAKRDSTWYVLRKVLRRNRLRVSVVAMALLVLPIFSIWMTVLYGRARAAEQVSAAKSTELAEALSFSNVERGRSLAAAGNTPTAEDVIFPELIRAGVTRIDGPEVGFTGSPEGLHAYWALWDVFRCSRCVATLRARDEVNVEWPTVKLLYFDQGGQRLNALDGRGRLTSWSVATWESVRDMNLFAPVEGVNFRVALAPGGSIAVFGASMIRVIDPETGHVEAQADDPDDQAVTGAFSPDGTLIATIGRGNRLRVRDARSLATVVMTADGPGGDPDAPPLSKPTFSVDGGLIAAARPDSLGLWNTTSGVLERSLRPPASLADKYGTRVPFGRFAFAPDGTIASSFGVNLVVWPRDGGAPLDLGEPGGTFQTVAFLPGSEGWMLVSTGSTPGGGGGLTIIWNVASGARVATFKHPDDSTALTTSPDGHLLVAGMSNGMVQVYETALEPHVTALQSGRVWLFPKLALSPDGRHLALTTEEPPAGEQDVVLVDIKTRATISRFRRTGPEIMALEFARDALSLFEYDRSGRVRQWDLRSESCVREFVFPEPHTAEPASATGTNQLRLSPDGRILARARDDGLIGLWDVPSGRWIGLLDSGTSGFAVIDFSPDGSTLAAQHGEALVLWDVPTRRPKRTIAIRSFPAAVRFSSAGPIIATSASGLLQFFNADTGRVLSECSPGTAGMGMAFHPEGTVFFASAFDTSIRLWDTRTGRELLSLQKHTQFIRSFVLTPDGNTLISSDWAGTVLVWDLTYYNGHIRRELVYRAAHPDGR